MRILFSALVLLAVAPGDLRAETLDRIVVSIGNTGITGSEVEQEIRFSLFLDGRPQPSNLTEAEWLAARDRLIERTLLKEEAAAEGSDASGVNQEANRLLNEVRNLYPDESQYLAGLQAARCTQAEAHQRLVESVRIVRLINRRLLPNAWVNQREIETYYRQTFVPEHERKENTPAPPLEEVESVIREILIQQEVDRLLDEWIKEIQATRRVKMHSQ